MTKNAGVKKVSHESKVRTVQSGSVTVRIYEGRNRGKPYFTVIWYIGERRMRKGFFELHQAKAFAKDHADKLAAGQVNSPTVTVAEAQEMKEAVRRIGELKTPVHVVAGEYADDRRSVMFRTPGAVLTRRPRHEHTNCRNPRR